jgi:hypothetical protein
MLDTKKVNIHIDPLNQSHIIINLDIECLQDLLTVNSISYGNNTLKLTFNNKLTLNDRIKLCNWYGLQLSELGGDLDMGMTTSELIERLKILDPSGEMEVTYNDGIEIDEVSVRDAGDESSWIDIR